MKLNLEANSPEIAGKNDLIRYFVMDAIKEIYVES